MALLHNITIKTKLLLITMVPLMALCGLAIEKIIELNYQVYTSEHITELTEISIAANTLVHEIQKERGASAGFTSSRGKSFADTLSKQRLSTNKKIEAYEEILSHADTEFFDLHYQEAVENIERDLSELKQIRQKIDALQLPLGKVVSYYSHLNEDLLSLNNRATYIANDADVIRDTAAYLGFLQSKERAGIERAVGSAGFNKGWDDALLKKLGDLVSIQDTYINVFKTFAADKNLELYKNAAQTPAFAKVNSLRKIAFKSNGIQNTGVSGTEWFSALSAKINILKKMEDELAKDLIHTSVEHQKHYTFFRNVFIGVVSVLIIAILLLTLSILKDLLHNIKRTEQIMQSLAEGDTSTEISGLNRKDEMGNMARAIDVFKTGLIEKNKMEEEAAKAKERAEQERQQMMDDMANSFDDQVGGVISSLSSSSGNLKATAGTMKNVAEENSKSSTTVAAASEEASANVNTVAAAMEEMAASGKEISKQINDVSIKSNDTTINAKEASSAVGNLNELVNNIGEVVVAIQDIAEQTNLLALNATIEAARAGDAGKGFAVVADEVKKLATETGNKTEEINTRISEIQNATQESVQVMEKIIHNISEIDEAMGSVSATVEEQSSTTTEIVRNISQAAQGVGEVSSIILDVQRKSGETGTSAEGVLTAAESVSDLSAELQTSVNSFLTSIRQGKG